MCLQLGHIQTELLTVCQQSLLGACPFLLGMAVGIAGSSACRMDILWTV